MLPPVQGSNKKRRKKKEESFQDIAKQLGTPPPKLGYNLRNKGKGIIKGRGVNLSEATQAKRHYLY
jgi:DNA-binding Lrp family transcriptional regulator